MFSLLALAAAADWSSGCLRQVDHVFSVGLGGGGGLLSVPDGLHLGQVGTVLILNHLVLSKPLVSPPHASNQCGPPGGLDKGGDGSIGGRHDCLSCRSESSNKSL